MRVVAVLERTSPILTTKTGLSIPLARTPGPSQRRSYLMTVRSVGSVVLTVVLVLASWASGIRSQTAQEPAESSDWPPGTLDGQPDIQGVWGSDDTGIYSLNIEPLPHLISNGMPGRGGSGTSPSGEGEAFGEQFLAYGKGRSIVIDPPTGILPHRPWALERRNSVMKDFIRPAPWQVDPQTRGWPNGIPRENYYSTVDGSVGGPIQILQPPGYVVFLFETHHEFRVVPLDGRPQPSEDIKLWLGSSRGRWEGNTLVIDVTNQNDSTRFDVVGNFHSDEMRVTERWIYVDNATIQYRATVDDPKVYTSPWMLGITFKRAPAGTELLEYAGVEGEQNAAEAEKEYSTRAR